MDDDIPADETYNPWTIVNAVFHHLADAGLHPVLGSGRRPGRGGRRPARRARHSAVHARRPPSLQDHETELAELRQAVFGDP